MNEPKDAAAPEPKHDSRTNGATKGSSKGAPVCGDGVREGAELCDGDDCKQEADCKSDKACIVSSLTGAAKTCDAECKTTKIDACKSGMDAAPTVAITLSQRGDLHP